ncbi:unnamed protein product [Pleuronectes platessa]|uniref:Uncharacterized protein n=1 Tax=Pleuronectes platessa TaxID=8262 RepID=A0A9N7UPU5_PLEPL|nr:unnamed protein product [Pleuronectes platessa]
MRDFLRSITPKACLSQLVAEERCLMFGGVRRHLPPRCLSPHPTNLDSPPVLSASGPGGCHSVLRPWTLSDGPIRMTPLAKPPEW